MNRCCLCNSPGTPHSPLTNIAADDGPEVLACLDAVQCAEAMNERADLLPYVLGADVDDNNPGDSR